jgi:phospholipid-transporting ATPase
MIMKADIGVGITGLEGMQAARASDFAIGQFRFLKPLMCVHGRECYRRNSDLVCYTFYKNFLFVFVQIWFGFNSAFSGQTFFDQTLYQAYNIVFTGAPIIWYATFDFEKDKKDLMNDASYYKIGLEDAHFNIPVFVKWLVYGGL